MATKKAKKCQICSTAFQGRRDAKTCSPACRKRLQRNLQSLLAQKAARMESALGQEFHRIAAGLLSSHVLRTPFVLADERGSVPVSVLEPPVRASEPEPVVQPQSVVRPEPVTTLETPEEAPAVSTPEAVPVPVRVVEPSAAPAPEATVAVPAVADPSSLAPLSDSLESDELASEPAVMPSDNGDTDQPVRPPSRPGRFSVFSYNKFAFSVTGIAVVLIALISAVGFMLLSHQHSHQTPTAAQKAGSYAVGSLPLSDVPSNSRLQLGQASTVAINGQLRVSNSLVLLPSTTPSNPETGQFYYDKATNVPYFYNGTQFVSLAPQHVSSIGGISGIVGLDSTLGISNNQLGLSNSILQQIANASSTGSVVNSLQGQTGNVTLGSGPGIGINGTTISNNGVLSLTGTADQVSVSSGTGNITLSLPQSIGVASAPTFGGLTVSGTVSVGTLQQTTPGNNLNISAGNDNITFTAGGRTFIFPTTGPASQTICTTGISCASGGGQAVLLQPGSAQTDTGSGPSIFVNNTGGGSLADLQSGGVDRFVVNNSGNVTAGTYNGQTISSAANFTGTLAVQGAGGITVGTPSSVAGKLSLANGTNGNLTSLQSAVPTQNQTIIIPDANAASDTVCLLILANCVGTGGGITGGGTVGTIPVFTGSGGSIGNSILTQSGSTVTVAGTLSATNLTGNGSGITALNASNIATGTLADARLSANVTLQGNTFNGPSQLVQLTAGGILPVLDGSNLTNLNGSNIASGTVANARLVNGGALTVTAGTGLNGGGSVALGGTTTLNVTYGSSANTAAQGNTALSFTGSGNLTGTVSGTAGGGFTSNTLAIVNSPTFSGTLAVQGAGGITVGVAGTTAGLLNLANGTNTNLGTIQTAALGQGTTYILPDPSQASVDICLSTGNCAGAGTGVTGSGTIGTIPVFTGTQAIGNSILTQSGGTVTVAGNLAATNLSGAGSGITALNASNISTGTLADARLSTNVTLQGNTFNGASQLVQLTAGGILPVLDGSNLTNLNGSNIASGTVANARLVNGGALTVTAGTGLNGGGSVALGGTTTLNVTYGSSASTAVEGNKTLTCASGTGNLTGGGNVITLGAGGSCNDITITNSPTFSGTLTVQGAGGIVVGIPGSVTGALNLASGTSANLTTLQSAAPSQNQTIIIPDANAASDTVCLLLLANCVGTGGGITGGGTVGTIPVFTGTGGSIGNSTLSQSGSTLTASGNFVIQGANSLSLGTAGPAGNTGSLAFKNSANANTLTLQAGATASNLTLTLPTADGSNGACLQTNGSGVLSFNACTGGAGGGVTSLDGLVGVLTINNSSGSGSAITIDNASTSQKGIAQFNSTNFTASSGTINTIQDIATTSAPSFATQTLTGAGGKTTLALTSTGSNTGITFGGDTTLYRSAASTLKTDGSLQVTGSIGANCSVAKICATTGGIGINVNVTGSGDSLDLQNNGVIVAAFSNTGNLILGTAGPSGSTGAIQFKNSTNANILTLQAGVSASSFALTLPTTAGANGDCLQGNGSGVLSFASCTGGPGGGVTSLDGLTGVLTINNSSGSGSAVTIDNAAANGTTKGIATFNSTNFTASSGVVNTIQDIATSSSPVFVSPNATTGVNTGAGAGTQRIDASGNLVNIGNLTGAGAVAIAAGGSNQNLTLNASGSGTVAIGGASTGDVLLAGGVSGNGCTVANSSGSLSCTSAINSTTGGIQTNSVTRIDNSGNATLGTISSGLINGQTISSTANFTGTLAVQGTTTLTGDLLSNGNTTIGNATTDRLTVTAQLLGATPLVFQGATDDAFTTSFAFTDPTANNTVTFRNGSGTVCFENSVNCGFALSGSGVTSLDGLAGVLTINNSSGSGSAITIDNAAANGTTKGIATFNSTNFTASSGVVNTIQDIATTSSPVFVSPNGTTGINTGVGAGTQRIDASGNLVNIGNLTGAGAVAIAAGGSNQNLTLNASGSGQIRLGGTSSGDILLAGGSGTTGCTITNSNGNLNCDGTINGATISGGNISGGTLSGGTVSGGTLTNTTVNGLSVSSGTITSPTITGTITGSSTPTITGFGTYNGQTISSAANFTGTLNVVTGYQINGTPGASTTCSGGQFLQNQVVSGGITTGGTCATAGGGVTTVGTINSQTKSADGAVIVGSSIYLQTADASFPGLVSTGTQTFAGDKTFTGLITGSAGAAVSGAAISLNNNSNFVTNINTGTSTGAVNIGNSAAGAIAVQSASSIGLTSGTTLNLTSTGANAINITPGGASNTGVLVKPTANSTAAFQVQDTGGAGVLVTDTVNRLVSFRTGTTGTQTILSDTPGGAVAWVFKNNSNVVSYIGQGDSSAGGIVLCASTTSSYCTLGQEHVRVTAGGSTVFQNSADSSTAFQIQRAGAGGNLFTVDTQNSRLSIGSAAPANSLLTIGTNTTAASGGVTFGTDTNLYRSGSGELTTSGNVIVNSLQANSSVFSSVGLSIFNAAANFGSITKDLITASSISDGDVVVLVDNGGSAAVSTTTTARDTRVYGVAENNVASAGGTGRVGIAGHYSVHADTAAVTVGDQLVTSTTTGKVTVDNNATTGIVGTATTAKAGGSNGTIGVYINSVGGQATPNFRSASATGFQIQNSSTPDNLFIADTQNHRIAVGQASASYTLDVAGDINSTTGYRIAGVAGASTTCSGGQFLQNQVVSGGITTGGTCAAAGGGITTVGTIDSQTKSANGAVISGSNIYLQTADASFPGLVSTGTQTFAGAKTFTGVVNANATGKTAITIADSGAQNSGITIGGDTNLYRSAANTLTTDDSLQVLGAGGSATSLVVQAVAGQSGSLQAWKNSAGSTMAFVDTGGYFSAGGYQAVGSSTSFLGYYSLTGPDINSRFQIQIGGQLAWGDGTAAVDTNLYRSAANVLQTDDSFVASGTINGLTLSSTAITAPGALSVTAGGSNQALTLNASGSGAINIGSSGTGNVLLAGGTGAGTGCTVTNSTGALSCSGDFDASNISANGNINIGNASPSFGAFVKTFTAGTGGISDNDVVVMNASAQVVRTTTARDTRVYGVSESNASASGSANIAISGNYAVNVDTGAVAIGDQLVTSTTSGKATVDNNATTGIIGMALSAKAGGSAGTVSININPVNGQATPNFRATSTTAFQIQNATTPDNLLVADTQNHKLGVGVAPGTSSSYGILQVGAASSTTADQGITFGGDTAVNLYRSASGILTTDGSMVVQGSSGISLGKTSTTDGALTFRSASSANSVTLKAGATATPGLTFTLPTADGTSNQCLQTNGSGALSFGSCASGSVDTLQNSYNSGNTVTTSSARDLSFTLADTATDSNFLVNTASGSTSKFAVQNAGTDVFAITNVASAEGSAIFKNKTNNATGFQVQESGGVALLTADTTGKNLQVGSSSTDANAVLLTLDSYNNATDPTGTNGAMYYNSSTSTFRCFQASAWTNCITPLPVSVVLGSDVSNSTTTAANVTGLSYSLAASTKYYYKFVILTQTAATATGIGFGVTTPGSPTTSNWCVNTAGNLAAATAGAFGSYCGTGDAATTTTAINAATTTYETVMEGYIQTTSSGTLQLRFKSEVAASAATAKTGSWGILTPVQ